MELILKRQNYCMIKTFAMTYLSVFQDGGVKGKDPFRSCCWTSPRIIMEGSGGGSGVENGRNRAGWGLLSSWGGAAR